MFSKVFFFLAVMSMLINSLNATASANAEIGRILNDHVLIVQANQALAAATQRLESAGGDRYPTLALNYETGNESIDPKRGSSSDLTTSQWRVGLNQTLWDFGKTSSLIDIARKEVLIKEAELNLQIQNLYLAGIEAYLNLKKSYVIVDFARQAEENIKTQTNLEDVRVNQGRGYKIDVLQAKAQLARASAERLVAEQDLSIAKNRYVAVFGVFPPGNADMAMPSLSLNGVPSSINELLSDIRFANPDIRLELANVEKARAEGRRLRATEFAPSLDLVFAYSNEANTDGVEGDRGSNEIAVQFRWDFNLAGQAFHEVRASEADQAVQKLQSYYTINTVTESARNAWSNYQAAKGRIIYLQDQMQMAGQFLELARKERELGRRSLIEVISGETALINARSDHSAAQIDVVIASYDVLRNAGKLTISFLRNG